MNIQSHEDKAFISQLVALYSIDNILTDISDKEQEMGTYFLQEAGMVKVRRIRDYKNATQSWQ